MEKILKIEEVFEYKVLSGKYYDGCDYSDGYEGYLITTDKQELFFGVSSGQGCCEQFGTLTTNDNLQDFVGANLIEVTQTDVSLNTKKIKDEFEYGFDEGGIIFVNINTDRGTLQLAAYNSHNGYYGHTVFMKSKQLNFKDRV